MNALRLGVCCLLLAACASPTVRYYRLQTAVAEPAASTEAGPTLQVGPVSLPAWLNRPQLVRTEPSGRVLLMARAEWAAPLPQLLAGALAKGIGAYLGWRQVRAWPSTSPYAADWLVTLDVHALSADAKQLRLDADWRVLSNGQLLGRGALALDEPLTGTDADALVAAHNRALDKLAAAMAASLRAIPR
ncbi:PqiC family protein [Paludibacterium purpuratum]|uniref:ABC-type transport auxiliary lipoprotein component domain-containing protein n=1 Tax=Paludibacterium purpuratum TaxID=1144873 RepID=A0A4R7B5K4_9NEIS|nr:PqiC family protein [Paludibacterium purpuratum]TDR79898.1 hypothetical protein DFP86_10637 [Paludibacterium purpuratum]